jgi:hypothetical protein
MYELPMAGQTRLVVYDVLGREVALLANEWNAAGTEDGARTMNR